jgi:hypothetical protein
MQLQVIVGELDRHRGLCWRERAKPVRRTGNYLPELRSTPPLLRVSWADPNGTTGAADAERRASAYRVFSI